MKIGIEKGADAMTVNQGLVEDPVLKRGSCQESGKSRRFG
jgi:hypothetical protein